MILYRCLASVSCDVSVMLMMMYRCDDVVQVSGYSVGCDVSADGQLIVSGSSDSRLVVYDYRRAQTRCCLPMSDVKDVVLDVAWHPVLSSTVAAATWNGHVILCQ